MHVFLIRHGETATSGRTYAGRRDVPLTPRGRDEARQIADRLEGEPVTHILTSPLSRAIDTAEPLARRLGLTPVVIPALSEIDFGIYEGREKGALGPSLRKTHAHRPIPGGEALADVWRRAGEVISLLPAGPASACAIVGHFWINRLLWGRLQGLSFEAACAGRDYRPRTGSCVVLSRAEACLPGDDRPDTACCRANGGNAQGHPAP